MLNPKLFSLNYDQEILNHNIFFSHNFFFQIFLSKTFAHQNTLAIIFFSKIFDIKSFGPQNNVETILRAESSKMP